MKQSLLAIWAVVLLLILGGLGMAMSPFVIEGGILNILNPVSHDNWIGYLLNICFAVVFGILIAVCGTVVGLWTGIATSIVAVTSQNSPPPNPPPTDSSPPTKTP